MTLSPQQIDQLRTVMARRRDALVAELRRDVGRAREESFSALAGTTPDLGDESVAALITDLDQSELTRDLEELRGLDAARARLANGSYGVCADCHADIEFERLRASPGTLRCLACQARHEKTFAGLGCPSL